MNLNSRQLKDNISHNVLGVAMVILALVAGCASEPPAIDMSPDADVTFDGLHEVKHAAAAKAWAKPGADLAGYTKIMLQGSGIEYRPGGETSRSTFARSTSSEFALTEKQKARFREVVGEVFIDELGKSEKFTLVNEPGADVLLVRGALLDVVSFVPPEQMGRGGIYLDEIGEVTLVLEIRDSVTEAIYVRVADRAAIGDDGMMRESNRATNTAEVRQTVRRWASMLRKRLDSFSGYANEIE